MRNKLILMTGLLFAASCFNPRHVLARKNEQIIRLRVDMKIERRIQKGVDEGHQPWRLEPLEVAYAAVLRSGGKVLYSSCRVVNERVNESRVQCEDAAEYIVLLRRLIRPDGIWTAVEIRKR